MLAVPLRVSQPLDPNEPSSPNTDLTKAENLPCKASILEALRHMCIAKKHWKIKKHLADGFDADLFNFRTRHTLSLLPKEALNIPEKRLQIVMTDQSNMHIQAAVDAVRWKVMPGMRMVCRKVRMRNILSSCRQGFIHCGTDLNPPAWASIFGPCIIDMINLPVPVRIAKVWSGAHGCPASRAMGGGVCLCSAQCCPSKETKVNLHLRFKVCDSLSVHAMQVRAPVQMQNHEEA